MIAGVLGALTIALAACGGDPATMQMPDAGALAVAPPMPPQQPGLAPCPLGWETEFIVPEAPICLPQRVAGQSIDGICDNREQSGRVLLGVDRESACATLGAECSESERFAPAPIGTDALYVDGMARTPGDGSRTAPFRSLADAIAAASAGATILLAPGRYEGAIAIDRDVTLVGACAGATELAAIDASDSTGAIDVTSARLALSNLHITAPARPAISARNATLAIDGVIVRNARGAGLLTSGGAIDARLLAVEDVIAGTVLPGRGISADRTMVTLDRSRVAIAAGGAIIVTGEGAVLHATNLIVSKGTYTSSEQPGRGISVTRDATGTLERVYVIGATDSAVLVADGAELMATYVVVEDTRKPYLTVPGSAIDVDNGAHARFEKLLVIDGESPGVLCNDAELELEDAVLIGPEHGPSSASSDAIATTEGGRLTARRIAVVGHGSAITFNSGATGILSDVLVARTYVQGFALEAGSEVSVGRLLMREARGGIRIEGGSTFTCDDCDVRTGRPEADSGRFGRGVEIGDSTASFDRLRIADAYDSGLLAYHSGLTVRDLVIADPHTSPCAISGCTELPGGFGVALESGHATIDSFSISGAPLCGLLIGGEAELAHGVVERNGIGVCMQLADYDVARLGDDVRYLDNGRNLDATSLPIPEPFRASMEPR